MKIKDIAVLAVAIFASSVALSAPEPSHSDGKITSILWNCNLSFSAHGHSIYIGLGYTHLEGRGVLSCYDLLTGGSEHYNLKVDAMGPGAGLGVTGLNVSGAAIGLKIAKDPASLLGRYISVRANAAVGVGAGVSVPIRVSKDDVSINLEVEGTSGLGVGLDILALDIQADGKKVVEPATVVPAPVVAQAPIAAPAVAPAVPSDAAASTAPVATSSATPAASATATVIVRPPAPAPGS